MPRIAFATLALVALAACSDGTAPTAEPDAPSLRLVTGISIEDLGLPAGAVEAYAYGINVSGDIAGYSVDAAGVPRAYRWTSGGGFQQLYNRGAWTGSYGFAINNSGHVVGAALLADGRTHAAKWQQNVAPQDLGTLGGADSWAQGINNKGMIVGVATDSSGRQRAFSYASGQMTDIGTLPGGSWSFAQSVNDNGKLVGFSSSANGDHAFAYTPWDAQMTDLGVLPGGSASYALGLNLAAQVVGFALTSSGETHAFLYDAGVTTDLGTLGGAQSVAYAVADGGEVVGYSQTVAGDYHAFVWTPRNGMIDLGTLPGDVASYAQGINRYGRVVGFSVAPDGRARAVRWQLLLK